VAGEKKDCSDQRGQDKGLAGKDGGGRSGCPSRRGSKADSRESKAEKEDEGRRVREFNEFREAMNQRILEGSNRQVKRFFNLDTRAYDEGALDRETKEMLGLVASLVLRCDECIKYHLQECWSLGISEDKIFEVFNVGLVVGGSIVIPHLREAVAFWDELQQQD